MFCYFCYFIKGLVFFLFGGFGKRLRVEEEFLKGGIIRGVEKWILFLSLCISNIFYLFYSITLFVYY